MYVVGEVSNLNPKQIFFWHMSPVAFAGCFFLLSPHEEMATDVFLLKGIFAQDSNIMCASSLLKSLIINFSYSAF